MSRPTWASLPHVLPRNIRKSVLSQILRVSDAVPAVSLSAVLHAEFARGFRAGPAECLFVQSERGGDSGHRFAFEQFRIHDPGKGNGTSSDQVSRVCIIYISIQHPLENAAEQSDEPELGFFVQFLGFTEAGVEFVPIKIRIRFGCGSVC